MSDMDLTALSQSAKDMLMDAYTVPLLLLANLSLLVILCYRMLRRTGEQQPHGLLPLQSQLSDLSHTLTQTIINRTDRMADNAQKVVTDLKESVNRQLIEVKVEVSATKQSTEQVFTIAGQLQNLERVLTHQKRRGILGEAGLELVLSNILPPSAYTIQYRFRSGETVDAVIITPEGLIPIDAKFPLDNYRRIAEEADEARRADRERAFVGDLRHRIDETAKYVKPEERTLPFAFMFIPAEGIFYDLLVNTRNVIDYAQGKKVTIVSPTTFAAYLQSVLYGFKAFKIEATAHEIARNVEQLARHLKAYEEHFRKVGATLATTVNHYEKASTEFSKIDKDVEKITGQAPLRVARSHLDCADSALE
jgi:DNA recombination protein RmuC